MTPGNPCTICKSEEDQKNEKNNSSNHKDQPFEMLHFMFFYTEALLVVTLLLKIQYLNHQKPKSKPTIQNPCFELQFLQQICIQFNTKIMDGKNDLIVQSSISMIVKTKDICPEYPRNMSKKSLKYAENILEICLKCP
jgi:hypothetical protein